MTMLSEQRILERLLACSLDPYFIDSSSCLSVLPNAIKVVLGTLHETCLECFSQFIDSFPGWNHTLMSSIRSDCIGINRRDSCLSNPYVSSGMAEFHLCAGLAITYPSCSHAQVRSNAVRGAFQAVLEAATGNAGALNILDTEHSVCGNCYVEAAGYLAEKLGNNFTQFGIAENCSYLSSPDSNCLTAFNDFFDFFRGCAGMDILRIGPECSQDQQLAIQAMNPYDTLTRCAFHPEESSCDSMGDYLNELEVLTNATCAVCYREYFDGLIDSVALYSVGSRCGSVSSGDCLAWNADQIRTLGNCTGFPVPT